MQIMLSFLVTLIVLILAGLGAILGLCRGLNRSLLRFGIVILSAFLAFAFATAAYPMLLDMPVANFTDPAQLGLAADATLDAFLQSLLASSEPVAELLAMSPTLRGFVMMLPQAIVAEILFVLFFFVLKFLLGFLQIFVNVFLLRQKKHRAIAAAVGGVQGIFCACILLLPLFGMMPLMDQVVASANQVATVDANGNKSEIFLTIEEIDNNFCAPIHSDPIYATFDAIGVRSLCTEVFYSLSNATDDNGDTRSFFREVEEVAPAVFNVVQLTGISFDSLSEQDVALIRNTVSTIQNSNLLSGVISDVLINGSDALANGGSVLGFSLSTDMDQKTSNFLTDVFSSIASSESEKLIDDLPNVVEAVVTVTQSGLINSDSSMTDILKDKESTVAVLSSLANSTTLSSATVSAVNNFGIAALGETLAIPEEELENMLIKDTEVFNKMTAEEKVAEVEKLADTIGAAVEILDKVNNAIESDIAEILPEAGKLLDNMSGSALLGDATKGVVGGLLNHESAKDLIPESAKENILSKVESGEINYESTLTSIGAAHNLSQSMGLGGSSSPDDAVNDEKIVGAVEQLFTALDEATAEILKESLSSALVQNMGVDEETGAIITSVFDALLDEIAKFKPTDETDYTKEAAAIKTTLNFVTTIVNSPAEAVTEDKIHDLLNTALESETITNTIISAAKTMDLSDNFDEVALADIAEILNSYENENIDSAIVAACTDAMRTVFGIDK